MPKCLLCNAETKSEIGAATVGEGWLFTQFRGPLANKYGVYCTGHKWPEVQASLMELAMRAAVPEGHR